MEASGIGDMVSALLLEAGAVRVSIDKPFTLTSGRVSPVYFDCRRLISYPAAMTLLTGAFQWLIEQEGITADIVAGGESAGIPFAARLASATGKPMVYVRRQSREHGTRSAVEGQLPAGSRVLLVEDMITDGASKLGFVRALRDADAVVEHCLVALDRQQGGGETLRGEGVRLHTLAAASSVLSYARRCGVIPEADIVTALEYLKEPSVRTLG